MDGADEEVVRLSHEAVGNVDDERARDGLHFDPSPRLAEDLEPLGVGGDNSEEFHVGVSSDPVLIVARCLLLRVVKDSGACLGSSDPLIEEFFRQMQSQSEDLGEFSGKLDHF